MGAATSVIFGATKVLSQQTFCLPQRKYACCDKHVCHNETFVATNICLDKHNFVTTKVLLPQAYFCRGKHVFFATENVFCCNKSMLVTTKKLLQQTCVCRDKGFVATKNLLVAPAANDALPHLVLRGQCL